jgi:hypothetical protein
MGVWKDWGDEGISIECGVVGGVENNFMISRFIIVEVGGLIYLIPSRATNTTNHIWLNYNVPPHRFWKDGCFQSLLNVRLALFSLSQIAWCHHTRVYPEDDLRAGDKPQTK